MIGEISPGLILIIGALFDAGLSFESLKPEVAKLALTASAGPLQASYAVRFRPRGQLARCFPF